jgi:hypothetical protein
MDGMKRREEIGFLIDEINGRGWSGMERREEMEFIVILMSS